uniref:Aminotransferase-like plant mobile domain-containing protein n=1 Tax=Arundo donax TaxID=35708 RepID=A0A0A8XXG6_ARUDO
MIEARIQHRFSSKRLEAVVLSLSDVQKGYITKHGFGHLLDVHHFHVPLPFLEWIVEHIIVRSCQFRYQNKTININRSMVGSVLGIPSGDTAVNLEVKDVTVKNKIKELRDNFFGRSKLSISEIIALLYGDEKEESFMMSFMLVALACVICPSTQNNVNLKYINCLMDPYAIRNYDWSGHALDYICIEIQKFQGAIDSHDDSVSFKPLYVGGCLPLLAIIYMDFLNIESLVNHHEISYSIPRLCNVKSSDFSFVIDIDCNKSIQRRFSFGVTSFREISATPYAPTQNESENSNSQQPFRDFSDNAIPSPFHVSYEDDPNFRAIVSKYKDLFREQVVSSVFPAVLGSILPIFSDQMALMSAEIYSYCLSLRHNTTSHAQNVNSTPNNNSSGLNVDGSFLEQNFSSLPNVHMNTISSTPMASQDIQRHNIHEVDNHGCAEFHVTIHRSFQGTPIHQHSNTSDATPLINTSMVSPSLSNIAPISPFGTGHTETINPHKQRIGSSTLKKRNRKRRQAIYPQEDLSVKITISDTVEKVYDVFVREEIHPAQHEINSPLFINICGFHCSYLRFRQSLKAKGQVYDDVMGLFVQLFNLEYLDIPESRFSRKKNCILTFPCEQAACGI